MAMKESQLDVVLESMFCNDGTEFLESSRQHVNMWKGCVCGVFVMTADDQLRFCTARIRVDRGADSVAEAISISFVTAVFNPGMLAILGRPFVFRDSSKESQNGLRQLHLDLQVLMSEPKACESDSIRHWPTKPRTARTAYYIHFAGPTYVYGVGKT